MRPIHKTNRQSTAELGERLLIACLTMWFVTLTSPELHAQFEPLQLVESTPPASPSEQLVNTPATKPSTSRFIKQPSINWMPEVVPNLFAAQDPLQQQPPMQLPLQSQLQPDSPRFAPNSQPSAEQLIQPQFRLASDPFAFADAVAENSGTPLTSVVTGTVAPQNNNATTKSTSPSFFFLPQNPVQFDRYGQAVPYSSDAFCAPPIPGAPTDPQSEALIYRGKTPIPTQRPWVELGRPLYTAGIYPPANSFLFGETNLLQPHFYVYGDYRTGVGVNENQQGSARSWASRLNLDMDWQLTATERIHAFMGPLDRNNDVSRIDFSDSGNIEFVNRADLRLDTLFFEGDVGAIIGGREGTYSPFDLPFSFGLMPLVYQNGIWMEDAALGAAFAIPTQHSTLLDWPNYEISFFALTDQVTTDAFAGDNNAAEVFGTAWFIDAYDGYIEADYAFVHDDAGGHRSYHNASIAFTRRYLYRLSNSVRFITNFDQALPRDQRTADGYLFLIENSLITSNPNYFVPYANFFYGSGRPQSVARAAVSGGILRNTGINFETDVLTGYPTLDATANNTYGAAFGLNMLGNNFTHQLVVEFAALAGTGSQQFRAAPGDQYAAGIRYQKPLSYRWIFRADSMYGWLRNAEDIHGNRIEFRWKF